MKNNLNVWRMYDKGEVDKLVARLEKKIEKQILHSKLIV